MSVQPSGTSLATPAIPLGPNQLSDVATVLATNDPHLYHGGTYESSGLCGLGVVVAGTNPCSPQDLLQDLDVLGWTAGHPGLVLSGGSCLGPITGADLQAQALRNVDARINRTIQDNLVGTLIPTAGFSSQAGGTDALASADAVARCSYLGQAVLHMHPSLVSKLGVRIIRVGRHLETISGAMVNPSCGMDPTKIGVTGALTIYKGANRIFEPMQMHHAVSGLPLNRWVIAVQTPVTVFNDCELAVLITGA
jgi:hypothetical protein